MCMAGILGARARNQSRALQRCQRRQASRGGADRRANAVSLCAALTKPASYSAGAKYTPAFSMRVEEAVEALFVGGHHGSEVLRQLGGEEKAEHAAFAVAGHRHAGRAGGVEQSPSTSERVRSASSSKKPGLAISRSVARPQAVATGLPDSVPA